MDAKRASPVWLSAHLDWDRTPWTVLAARRKAPLGFQRVAESRKTFREAPPGGRRDLEAGETDFLAALALEEVDALREAHPVAAHAHHERVRPRAVGAEAHATQEIAVGDSRRADDRLAGRQVVGREDLVDVVDALVPRLLD